MIEQLAQANEATLRLTYTSDWHPAPRRQFVVLLTGAVEVTVSDGETRPFGPGSVFLVEDIAGAGRREPVGGLGGHSWRRPGTLRPARRAPQQRGHWRRRHDPAGHRSRLGPHADDQSQEHASDHPGRPCERRRKNGSGT